MSNQRHYFYSRVREPEPEPTLKAQIGTCLKSFNYIHAVLRILSKSSIIVLLFVLTLPLATSALFFDQESVKDNHLATGTLDLEVATLADDFAPASLLPGQTTTQNALLINSGSLPFVYSQEISNAAGDTELCDNLNMKTWYYYYDDLGVLQKILKYNGALADFEINTDGLDPDMVNANFYPYFANTDYADNEHWYYYEILLPDGSSSSLGSSTCTFDIVSKAWQEGGTFGTGFWDEEMFSASISTGTWARVTGMKFNDLDGDGTKDEGEPGLPDWTIYAAKEFEKFNVLSTGEVHVTESLDTGITYLIRARGTFTAGDNITADAKYSIKPPSSTDWTDSVKNYESYGPELLDLQIDDSSPDWGTYTDDHEYWLVYTGNNQPLSFDINDIYPVNNIGSLEVTIFEAVLSTLTDADGNYELDYSGLDGEIVVAEEIQDGWAQTFPAKGYYTFVSPAIYEDRDFGNVEVPDTPDLVKIVINEVYYDVDSEHGQESGPRSDEWVELYNPNDFDIDLKNWTLTDNTTERTITHPSKYIPAHGFAVIAKAAQTWSYWTIPTTTAKFQLGQEIGNGLSNSGDALILKNPDGEIVDQISWGTNTSIHNPSITGVAEGHSIARSPLGFDTDNATDWTDLASPNPGTNPHSHIQVSVNQEDDNLIIGFTQAHGFDSLKYSVIYDHLFGSTTIQEAIQGTKSKALNQETLILTPIYFGTCSTNGLVCVPHRQVNEVEINLEYLDGTTVIGNSQIIYNWQP